jgi:predicted ATPase
MAVRLQFEGIRCFSEPQEAEVRPITLLVGENSAGKSTFLAIYRLAYAIANRLNVISFFNQPPFMLGAYEQIASYRQGRAGRAKKFSIGVIRGEKREHSLRAEFASRAGQPYLDSWRLESEGLAVQFMTEEEDSAILLEKRGTAFSRVTSIDFEDLIHDWTEIRRGDWAELLESSDVYSQFSEKDLSELKTTQDAIRRDFAREPFAFAPIRTEPKRTYDPVGVRPEPEGSHVPMLLAQLARSSEKQQWTKLRAALKDFGAGSGLFADIEVVQKGKKESDPFQVGVKTSGPPFNLVDVGYGVSQSLPILVDVLLHALPFQDFLLQQPEVHLHPKAQAELGRFFAKRADKRKRFLIETHSDYLVDRVRMEVRRGTLMPDDVSLLYFERGQHGATIHNLQLDKHGSITNPPTGFRQFFLDEERDILEL